MIVGFSELCTETRLRRSIELVRCNRCSGNRRRLKSDVPVWKARASPCRRTYRICRCPGSCQRPETTSRDQTALCTSGKHIRKPAWDPPEALIFIEGAYHTNRTVDWAFPPMKPMSLLSVLVHTNRRFRDLPFTLGTNVVITHTPPYNTDGLHRQCS